MGRSNQCVLCCHEDANRERSAPKVGPIPLKVAGTLLQEEGPVIALNGPPRGLGNSGRKWSKQREEHLKSPGGKKKLDTFGDL